MDLTKTSKALVNRIGEVRSQRRAEAVARREAYKQERAADELRILRAQASSLTRQAAQGGSKRRAGKRAERALAAQDLLTRLENDPALRRNDQR